MIINEIPTVLARIDNWRDTHARDAWLADEQSGKGEGRDDENAPKYLDVGVAAPRRQ